MSDLVTRLAKGEHQLEMSLRPEKSVSALKECLDRGHVHVRFTQTRGGTELGFPVDSQRSDWSSADFTTETGRITLVGELSLDFVPVRCVATIELPSLDGTGHLELIDQPVEAAGS